MNQNTQTVTRMKAVSQSRKQTIYFTMKVALTAFSRIVSLYKVLRAAKRDRLMKESEKEVFKPGGFPYPKREGKFISEEGPEYIVNKRGDWRAENPDDHLYKQKYIFGNWPIRENDEQFAERVKWNNDQVDAIKKASQHLKSVKHLELPTILHMTGQRGGKTQALKDYLKHCISTDCCGKCEKDKPQ